MARFWAKLKRLPAWIKGREHARSRAKRYWRFAKEATQGLHRTRQRIKSLREALNSAAQTRARLAKELRGRRRQMEEAEARDDAAAIAALRTQVDTLVKRRNDSDERIEHLEERIAEERARVKKLKLRAKRAFRKRRHWRKRTRFFIVKIRHFRKLQKQRRSGQPRFEAWMANGADWHNSNRATREWVARMVVLHGLTITSMNRTFVPAGGSTTSYHLQGMAGDAAGSWEKMVAAQRAEHKRGLGDSDYLELFGPDNDLWLKNGQDTGGAEGEALEDLHDTHVHGALA